MTATVHYLPPAEPTEPIPAPWLMPPVTATYRTPRARARHIAYRLARSPFVADVKARLPWVPQGIGVLTAAYFLLLVIRGAWVAAEMAGVAR